MAGTTLCWLKNERPIALELLIRIYLILDEFENLNQLISIDWSASEGDVVYTLSIRHQYQTTTAATKTTTNYGTSVTPSPQNQPYIFLATKSSPFELHPYNNSKSLFLSARVCACANVCCFVSFLIW